ncbi:putative leucine-rich repeat-containing protein DDB_G0290503 isoform X1 [Vespa crabro]|nr:putative leucine-rich repeat-containing protein DDB_G0290503 isoform X1 [Vespa crabro]
MQTEVPTLPVVHLNVHENVDRKQNSNTNNIEEKKSYSLCRSTCPSSNKKCLHPLLGMLYIERESYKNTMRVCSTTISAKPANKNNLTQRVVSAKMLRIKQLQNQLADAHYHLNELANENRLLKALQKRQDSALRRYEGTTAELPKIINSHQEELRILQIKHKKLKALHKNISDLLKEKENELYSLQTQNKHLLQLSKDRNLAEREKLQMQVSELNHKIMQQQENIQLLERKLALERKSLKHQLFVEISKHKQTQKNLQEALEKVKDLEHLIGNKTRKQLLIDKKNTVFVTQSLTNLRNVSTAITTTNKYKKYNDGQNDNLPTLITSQLNNDIINNTVSSTNASQQTDLPCPETVTSSRDTHKLYFQTMSQDMISSLFDDQTPKFKDLGSKLNKNVQTASYNENDIASQMESGNKCIVDGNSYEVSTEQHEQFDNFSDYSNSEHENDEHKNRNYHLMNTIKNSQDLHTRMINNTDHDLTSYITDSKESESNAQFFSKKIYNENFQKQAKILNQKDYDYQYKFKTNQEECTEDGFSVKFKNDKFDKIYSDSCSDFNTNDMTNEIDLKVLRTKQKTDNANSEVNLLQNESIYEYQSDLHKNVENPSIETIVNNLEYNLNHMHIQDEKNHLINDHENLIDLKLDTQHTYDENETTSMSLQQDEFQGIEKYSTVNFELDQEIKHSEIDKDYPLIYDNISYSIDKVKDELQQNNYGDQHTSTNSIMEGQRTISNGSKVEFTEDLNNDVITTLQMNKKKKSLSNSHTANNSGKSYNNTNKSDHKAVNKSKSINYNKEKLLATMKAIDNNEDIDFFIDQHFPKRNSLTRFQITENLFRGLPAHSKKNYSIINDVFDNGNMDNKISLT